MSFRCQLHDWHCRVDLWCHQYLDNYLLRVSIIVLFLHIQTLFDHSDILIKANWCWGMQYWEVYWPSLTNSWVAQGNEERWKYSEMHCISFGVQPACWHLNWAVMCCVTARYTLCVAALNGMYMAGTYETEEGREYSEVHFMYFIPCMCCPAVYYPKNALRDTTNVTYINSYMFRHRGTLFRD